MCVSLATASLQLRPAVFERLGNFFYETLTGFLLDPSSPTFPLLGSKAGMSHDQG